MIDFAQTMRGAKYYDADVPRIAAALTEIGSQMKIQNALLSEQIAALEKVASRLARLNLREDGGESNVRL